MTQWDAFDEDRGAGGDDEGWGNDNGEAGAGTETPGGEDAADGE